MSQFHTLAAHSEHKLLSFVAGRERDAEHVAEFNYFLYDVVSILMFGDTLDNNVLLLQPLLHF